ncbi:hypothetical protein Hypma_006428 [Hypsizygus marmoreus]|uniref:Ricin B lectin domain-containing protein n=1 Tax=Hypsizygus marmoreus TaxID=39966 RepID=A0A369JV79_HYPMA|nr:hypothetical protein Hypma_006428 [Hypsizygus marmoreus]
MLPSAQPSNTLSSSLPPTGTQRPQEGILPTGQYLIETVTGRLYVTLTDGNRGTPFTTTNSKEDENTRFTVTKLTKNNVGDYSPPAKDEEYEIASFEFANFAVYPQDDLMVQGKADPFRWVIRELDVKGQYLICSRASSNPRVFWMLDDRNPGSTVKLTSDDSKAQVWKLTREFH